METPDATAVASSLRCTLPCNKLPQNLVSSNNRYVSSQFLWVRNLAQFTQTLSLTGVSQEAASKVLSRINWGQSAPKFLTWLLAGEALAGWGGIGPSLTFLTVQPWVLINRW